MAENQPAEDDDWSVPCSDDEKYEITPDDMKELFEKVARNEPLVLQWKCPGRRSPTPERPVDNPAVEEKMEVDVEPQQNVSAAKFDFYGEPSSELNTVTPRRVSGNTKTPRSKQKRVARLDKIMDDMKRHQKMDEEASRESSPADPTGQAAMSEK